MWLMFEQGSGLDTSRMSELEQLRQEAEQLRNQIRVNPAFVASFLGVYDKYIDILCIHSVFRMPGKHVEIQP